MYTETTVYHCIERLEVLKWFQANVDAIMLDVWTVAQCTKGPLCWCANVQTSGT